MEIATNVLSIVEIAFSVPSNEGISTIATQWLQMPQSKTARQPTMEVEKKDLIVLLSLF